MFNCLIMRHLRIITIQLLYNISLQSCVELLLPLIDVPDLADDDKDEDDEAADNTEDPTSLNNIIVSYSITVILYLTCMMVGNITSMLRDPAMFSGKVATESNQKTGNITSGRFLNRYSIPSTFLSNTFSWSLISTLMGMDDLGSTQKELS